ncbi:glycosyltransferase family 4 protein [Hufsiella ginkgonis]|uniref:Glycosyltransferase n=1 Tax=Hufsiella ginkgonis TaxID=2695274 RepID=A0A7K1Y3P9_9SPHI|nr:glycosyltransferase family 4 protein [Hufsiella ginkgonis]MXV17905.1 glycosyltransferase [Hufsiella ginkgonis]
MRVLFITNRVPFPPNSGYPIVVHNTISGLVSEGAEVTLFSLNPADNFVETGSLDDPLLKKIRFQTAAIINTLSTWELVLGLLARRSFHVSRFYKSVPVAKLKNLLKHDTFDVIQLEGLFVMPYLNTIRQHSNAKIVYRAHNIEYLVSGTNASSQRSPLRRIYSRMVARRLLRFELENINRTDAVLTINRFDQAHLESIGCRVSMENFPVAIDTSQYQPDQSKTEYRSIFHIGTMNSFPAMEGLDWFIRSVWKDLEALNAGLKFHIAGRDIPEDLYYYENDHFVIHDDLDDAREFINSKPVMIVPLRTGSGMRVKIIEGMAMKKCVISTSLGAEGINYEHGKNILIADTPAEFYKYILQSITDRRICEEIGENARKLVEKEYNLKSNSQRLLAFYETITAPAAV